MSEYGYIPEVAQSFGDNTGVFDPADINNLVKDDKWTQYGQLELIETQTVSSASVLDFTAIQESTYNVHFLTVTNVDVGTDNAQLFIRFSSDGGSSFVSSGYQFAYQFGTAGGTFSESRTTSIGYLTFNTQIGNATNEVGNGYSYFYNLGDSTKYSFQTAQTLHMSNASVQGFSFGSGVLPQTSTHNAIRLYTSSGTFSATASLYGIKEYS